MIIKSNEAWLLILATFLSLPLLTAGARAEKYSTFFKVVQDGNNCTTMVHHFDPLRHKPKYMIGIFNSEGDEVVDSYFNYTFRQYLTETAGQRFNPPIEFDFEPVSLTELMEGCDQQKYDFFFASSAVSSCMMTEKKAQALVTVINRRNARGREYDLDMYGGVIFTMAENDHINTFEDLKDRHIGAGGITMMGGGQTQFHALYQHGISFVADPAMVSFTNDEHLTVQGVLDGDFEVGLARTDQIERHRDKDGKPLHRDTFKVLNPQTHILDDGQLFPFLSSTSLHPEWPVAALDHVDKDVAKEVQDALLALRDHAEFFDNDFKEKLRCETTQDLAMLSRAALDAASFTGFRTARNYFEVRTKQEEANFLIKEDNGDLHCIRGDTLYDDIKCPESYYKLSHEEFDKSCERVGRHCNTEKGYQCFCKPCVKAYEVDIYQVVDSTLTIAGSTNTSGHGCDKMSLCGLVEQAKDIEIRAIDNRKRDHAVVEGTLHLEHETFPLDVHLVEGEKYMYEFHWSNNKVGVGIVEIFFDGVQIPESPIRVQVVKRDCNADFPGEHREAAGDGSCVCGSDTVDIRGRCVDTTVFYVAGSLGGVFLVAVVGYFILRWRTKKADSIWHIEPEDLHFDDPVEIIGQGSFGVVLLAEYRGTKVAIKHAIKEGLKRGGSRHGGSSHKGKASGSLDKKNKKKRKQAEQAFENEYESESSTRSSVSGEHHDLDLEAQQIDPTKSGSLGYSLGFLVDEGAHHKFNILHPFRKDNDYHTRFRQAILGGSGSATNHTSSISFGFFACCNENKRRRDDFIQEMRILSRLRHPGITTVMGAVMASGTEPMLVMEYMEYGSLHDLLRNESMHLSGEIILQILRDTAQGLRYLHQSRPPILHGDLKARNVLVDSRFRAKLCDFGLSTKRRDVITGTPYWLAPEYLVGDSNYTTGCDIYSFGITLFEIFARTSPYEGEDFKTVLRGVTNKRINKRPKIAPETPPKFVELMKKCWTRDTHARITAQDLDMTLMSMGSVDAEPLDMSKHSKEIDGDAVFELFPPHIAAALKAGKKVDPENHEMVTVVFADIVGFNLLSRELPPQKLSDLLSRLYHTFDQIAQTHEVFKVETIGESYMGVTNLENDQEESHVDRIAQFSLELIREAQNVLIDEDDLSRGHIEVQVGFHSGPVVSQVTGNMSRAKFGLFGDTVNVASRLAANSGPNRVLCSDFSHQVLKQQAADTPMKRRGNISVKGKGHMCVYWVGEQRIRKHSDDKVKKMAVAFTDENAVIAPRTLPSNPTKVAGRPQGPPAIAFADEPALIAEPDSL